MMPYIPPLLDLSPSALVFSGQKNGVMIRILATPEIALNRLDFNNQCERLFAFDYSSREAVSASLGFLGLSFCLVRVDFTTHQTFIAAGPTSLFRLYFRNASGQLHIADRLPAPTSRDHLVSSLDSKELVRFLASAWSSGPFELTFSSASIRSDWQRLPNSHYMVFDKSASAVAVLAFDNIFNGLTPAAVNSAEAIDALRHAIDDNIKRLAASGKVSTEFSGGIDSGIVYARANAMLGTDFLGGVTAEYPFFEFRREGGFRESIVRKTGGHVHFADPMKMLPFLRLREVPYHDEPSVGSTSWGQFAEACATAERIGSKVLLNGHGGDVIFLIPPTAPLRYAGMGEVPDWIPKQLAKEISGEAEQTIDSMNTFIPGLSGYWHPGMFESGYLGRYATSDSPSVHYTSGLVSRDILRAAWQLWTLKPALANHVQKPMAYAAFRNDLPVAVWQRPGKVNHVANVFRGAKAAAKDILDIATEYSAVLDIVGISPAAFVAQAHAVVNGRNAANRFFSQVISVLIWVDSSVRASDSRATSPRSARLDAQSIVA